MSYFMAHSGTLIDFYDIKQKDISIVDIAHHLTNINRYGGALQYGVRLSVASHSSNLCEYGRKRGLSKLIQKALLLHDASEAYLGDIPSGLKAILGSYKELEKYVAEVIYTKYFGRYANKVDWKLVHELDKRILLDESKVFAPHHYNYFMTHNKHKEALGVEIELDGPHEEVEHRFLEHFHRLSRREI